MASSPEFVAISHARNNPPVFLRGPSSDTFKKRVRNVDNGRPDSVPSRRGLTARPHASRVDSLRADAKAILREAARDPGFARRFRRNDDEGVAPVAFNPLGRNPGRFERRHVDVQGAMVGNDLVRHGEVERNRCVNRGGKGLEKRLTIAFRQPRATPFRNIDELHPNTATHKLARHLADMVIVPTRSAKWSTHAERGQHCGTSGLLSEVWRHTSHTVTIRLGCHDSICSISSGSGVSSFGSRMRAADGGKSAMILSRSR